MKDRFAAYRYSELYERSMSDPDGFWGEAARAIDWIEAPRKVFDRGMGVYGLWFTDGVLNTCYNAVDRHVHGGRANQLALIHDSPLTNSITRWTYAKLLAEVRVFASVMSDFGVGKGDRVIIYMPLVPEAVVAMLACARIGAIHSVVFGGFASKELATRIDDAEPRLILSASCGLEPGRIVRYKPLLEEALKLARHKPDGCIILQRPQHGCDMRSGFDHDWRELRAKAIAGGKGADCVPVLATDPLYILYTSGTTGAPKGIVRDNGGHLVALKWSMFNLHGVHPGEVWWSGSDIGWVVGHSYIVYGPLSHGMTTVMYEGKPVGTPDAGAIWRVMAKHGVVAFYTAPTAFRAIRKEDPEGRLIGKYDLSRFRTLFLAGERADPPTMAWIEKHVRRPVIDHWWQTETGWAIAGNPVGIGAVPVKHGSASVAVPGFRIEVVDDAARPVPPNTMGSIVVRLPLPPGCLPTLWRNDARCREAYLDEFPGYYKSADAGFKDEDGYLFVMGRTDDIINVAGHRLSTGSMEEIIASHPDVAECAVLGISDPVKGEVPCGFLVLKAGCTTAEDEIEQDAIRMVRDKLGPVAAFKLVLTVARLPKTRSGKVVRGTIKKIADGEPWALPATIEDPVALDEIRNVLMARRVGLAGATR